MRRSLGPVPGSPGSANHSVSHREFYELSEEKKETLFPHDPQISMDYTGTSYFVMTVELDKSA